VISVALLHRGAHRAPAPDDLLPPFPARVALLLVGLAGFIAVVVAARA
jgi:hypothetical protein